MARSWASVRAVWRREVVRLKRASPRFTAAASLAFAVAWSDAAWVFLWSSRACRSVFRLSEVSNDFVRADMESVDSWCCFVRMDIRERRLGRSDS